MHSKQHQHHQNLQHSCQYYTSDHCQTATHNSTYLIAHSQPDRSSYHGDARNTRFTELNDSFVDNRNWILGDLRNLHRCIPALRRTGIDVSGIHMHFYPEGGWGWLICAASFLSLLLTTGMQLAFGQLHIYVAKHLGKSHLMNIAWIGSLSAAVSRASAPLVLGTCRRGSTRLTAVIGGLVLALAALFTSFAVQPHQILLSYGLVLGAGAGLVRETAGLVLGHYFRKRREFVEMIVQTGTGIGIALFSISYKEIVGKLGWRLGLQTITGILFLTFFLGLVYRSASLYHPQRHAIVHLKNQQNKLKSNSKSGLKTSRQPFIDLSPLNYRPVRMLMLAAGIASFGLYSPVFYIALQEYQEKNDQSTSLVLQTCLGLSVAIGSAAWGIITVRPSIKCLVYRQYLCQGALLGVAITQMALGNIQEYYGLVLVSALYGVSLGGTLYSLKMLALERLKSRQFTKSWALIQAAEAMSILLGVPLTGYMNASSPRVGYYACSLSSLSGAALLFLVGWSRRSVCSPIFADTSRNGSLGLIHCACSPINVKPVTYSYDRLSKSQSLHTSLNMNKTEYSSLATQITRKLFTRYTGEFRRNSFYGDISQLFDNQQLDNYENYQLTQNSLRASKSVPEGLDEQRYNQFYQLNCDKQKQREKMSKHHEVTVIEQITSV